MANHRTIIREGLDRPDKYTWDQGRDFYVRKDSAGMFTKDGRLKRISCSVCGITKGYLPSTPCDCSFEAEWEVRVRPILGGRRPHRGTGYTALPDGGGTLNRIRPHMTTADLPPERRKLTASLARQDLEAEGFTLPAPRLRLSKHVADELLVLAMKA